MGIRGGGGGGAQSDSQGPLVSAQLSDLEHKWPMGGGGQQRLPCPHHCWEGRGAMKAEDFALVGTLQTRYSVADLNAWHLQLCTQC